MGREMGVIDSILEAAPTDGLWDDKRTDEDQLGVSYDDLEWAMEYDGSETSDRQKHILEVYNKHRNANIHKMVDIPIYYKEREKNGS